jgi:selenocysteine-specific elongation factor
MNRLLLGVIGHVDHGKTALVRALSGMDTDRLPEEKRRGISIALGFAHLQVGDVEVDLIDMPGHERFVRTMVSGATGVSAVLLVVDASEGVKPQTVEHVDVAALLGIRLVIPVISKVDLASAEQAQATAAAVGLILSKAGLQAGAPILTSVVTGEGLVALRGAIADVLGRTAMPSDDGFPYLAIDRAFSMSGHGTVVTGTLRHGWLSADEALVLAPSGLSVRVRGLQVHGVAVERAGPGQRVAVNLRGVDKDQVARGAALTAPDLLAPSDWLSVTLNAVADAPPLKTGAVCSLLFGTTEVEARVRLLDRSVLEPGAQTLAQLHCAEPVSVAARERFILRQISPALTIAGGRVLDPDARRLKRNDTAVAAPLLALSQAQPSQVIATTLVRAGSAGVRLARLARLAGLAPARVAEHVETLDFVRLAGDLLVDRPAFDAVGARLISTLTEQLAAQPNGLARRRLGPLLPDVSAEVLDGAITALVASGRLRQEGAVVRLPPRASDEQARVQRETALASRLAEAFRAGGLTPPDVAAVATDLAGHRTLDRLVREGVLVKTFDKVLKREIVFHTEAVDLAKAGLAPLLSPPGLLVKDAGAALGISRKFSVPLLEHLDLVRFTRRLGDRRVLGPAGLARTG